MPTFRSMCQGGIWWVLTRSLMDLTHGRTSSYVMSDMGAIDPTRWQSWHFAWRIGATSFANVTRFDEGVDCAISEAPDMTSAATAAVPNRIVRHIQMLEGFIASLLLFIDP